MPGPAPLPLIGEMFNFIRHVNRIVVRARDRIRLSLSLGRLCERYWTDSKVWSNYWVRELTSTKVSIRQDVRVSSSVYEGTAPLILLSDPDLLRKILIKDSHLFINRRVYTKKSGVSLHSRLLFTVDARRHQRSFGSWPHSSQRRRVEKCSKHCLTDVFDGKTKSCKGLALRLNRSNRLPLDVRLNEWSEWYLQQTSAGLCR